jgi:hypothetical protein
MGFVPDAPVSPERRHPSLSQLLTFLARHGVPAVGRLLIHAHKYLHVALRRQ